MNQYIEAEPVTAEFVGRQGVTLQHTQLPLSPKCLKTAWYMLL